MIIRCNNYHVFYFIIFYIAIRAWLRQQHMSVTACQQFVYIYQPIHTRIEFEKHSEKLTENRNRDLRDERRVVT